MNIDNSIKNVFIEAVSSNGGKRIYSKVKNLFQAIAGSTLVNCYPVRELQFLDELKPAMKSTSEEAEIKTYEVLSDAIMLATHEKGSNIKLVSDKATVLARTLGYTATKVDFPTALQELKLMGKGIEDSEEEKLIVENARTDYINKENIFLLWDFYHFLQTQNKNGIKGAVYEYLSKYFKSPFGVRGFTEDKLPDDNKDEMLELYSKLHVFDKGGDRQYNDISSYREQMGMYQGFLRLDIVLDSILEDIKTNSDTTTGLLMLSVWFSVNSYFSQVEIENSKFLQEMNKQHPSVGTGLDTSRSSEGYTRFLIGLCGWRPESFKKYIKEHNLSSSLRGE